MFLFPPLAPVDLCCLTFLLRLLVSFCVVFIFVLSTLIVVVPVQSVFPACFVGVCVLGGGVVDQFPGLGVLSESFPGVVSGWYIQYLLEVVFCLFLCC